MLSDRDLHVVWTTKAGANVSWKDFCEIARAIEREAIANFLNESGQYLTNDASREAAICEATAPLIAQIKQLSDQADRAVSVAECANKQIKEDEALMLMALDALSIAATWMPLNHRIDRVDSPIESLRQRLEAKK